MGGFPLEGLASVLLLGLVGLDVKPSREADLRGRGGGAGGVFRLISLRGGRGGGRAGSSSSQTCSTIPERMNAHRVHVERRRVRHHPEVQSGYIVELCVCVWVVEVTEDAGEGLTEVDEVVGLEGERGEDGPGA